MNKYGSNQHNDKNNNQKGNHITTMKEKKEEFENIVGHYLENNPHMKIDRRSSELEIRFGTNTKLSNPITKIDYDDVVRQLLSCGFKAENIDGNQILRIQNEYIDTRTGQTKMSNIRAEIVGTELIQQYCRTNSIQKLIDLPSTTTNKLKWTRKSSAMTKTGTIIKKLDMDDFNFRVSYQTEQDFNVNSNIARDIISKWLDSKKTFRCLNRVRFYHPDYPVFADLSIIKSSKRTNYVPIPEYTIQEANVFNNMETYEIELEIDNNRVGTGSKFNTVKSIMDSIRKCIRIVLCGLQKTKYPISYIQRQDVLNSYMGLIHGNNPDYDWRKRRIRTRDFIGPNSISLQIENIQELNEDSNVVNIRNDYSATEKADGERRLLFINEEGNIYMIDTNMNVISTGAKTNEKTLYNSLADGEYIKTDKNNEPIHLFAAFDLYYVGTKSIRHYPFYPSSSPTSEESGNKENKDVVILDMKCNIDQSNLKYRLPLLDCFVDLIKPVSILEPTESATKTGQSKKSTDFRIQRKNFYATSLNYTIFEGCSEILSKIKDGLFEYTCDGIIFTPCNLAVGAEYPGGNPSPLVKTTWKHSFKWKPPEFNTIDFLVSVKKDNTGKDELHNIFQEGRNLQNGNNVVQYKTLILRCGFNEREHGYINPFQDILNDTLPTPDDIDNEDLYKPVPFQPTNPYDPNACYCNIMLKENGSKMYMMTEENEYFEENTIVEFKYDARNEDGWKWVPIRVRYDKTADLNAGQKNYGNPYHVANNNWHSIHYPITEEMISSGKHIPEMRLSDEVYYNRSNEETSTQSLRNFHNLFVKNNLIQAVSNRGDILIDYAVGKAGDMSKWITAKLKFVFGIDISKDNIQNHLDGACARFLNARKKYPKMLHALFVNGDSKLNIRNGDAFMTEKDKQISKAVFGVGPKDAKILGKGVYNQYGVAESGFNISSCQFAMHYFFENKTVFHQFMRNISECTKLGGYFIGTCYDGKTVFELLNSRKKGESMTIIKNDRKIFEITKMYDQTGFPDDELSLGYPINVFQESINQVFREYLVNFEYLVRVMEDYGFVLITKEEAVSMNIKEGTGMFSSLFNEMEYEIKRNPNRRSDYRSALFMSPEEKQISFMNRYFIFKKNRSVAVDKLQDVMLKKTERIDKTIENDLKELAKEEKGSQKVKVVIRKKFEKPPEKGVVIQPKKKVVLKKYVPVSETSPENIPAPTEPLPQQIPKEVQIIEMEEVSEQIIVPPEGEPMKLQEKPQKVPIRTKVAIKKKVPK